MNSRSKFKNKNEFLYDPVDKSRSSFVVFFTLSIIVHFLFFCSLIFFQDFKLPKPMPNVIQIDLVSFAAEPAIDEAAKAKEDSNEEVIPAKIKSIKKTKTKIPTIKPDISLKSKPKNLKDLIAQQEKKKKAPEEKPEKKKPLKNERPEEKTDLDIDEKQANEQMEKQIEDRNQDKIAEALSRLQKKVSEQGETKEDETKGKYAGFGKKGYKPIDLYKMVLGSAIEQNWVFNNLLAGMDQTLEVRILIKILKSGEIRDIIYETKSGNRYLDESAKKAIQKANPLPELPTGMHSYDVVVIFTPKGLK